MSGELWLARNDRFEWVRYDTATGRVVGTHRPQATRPTAGLLGICLRTPVALYVDGDGTGLVLQSGPTAIELDAEADVGFRVSGVGHLAHLTVERGADRLKLREFVLAAPDADDDHVRSRDFLATVYDIHTRPERREQ